MALFTNTYVTSYQDIVDCQDDLHWQWHMFYCIVVIYSLAHLIIQLRSGITHG